MGKIIANPTIRFGTMTGVDVEDLDLFVRALLRAPISDVVESLKELERQLDIAQFDGLEALDLDLKLRGLAEAN